MKADRLSHFAFPFQYRQPLFHPFIKIDDRLSAFQRLVHRVECSPFRYKIPIGYDCIRFTHHVFIPAKVAAETGLPLPEGMKFHFLLIPVFLFNIDGKALFEQLKIFFRCNVMSYGVTYRIVCKSIN